MSDSIPEERAVIVSAFDNLSIEYPHKLPDMVPVTKTELKAAWREFITPVQEQAALSGEPPTDGFRALAACFRSVYAAIPEDVVEHG